MAKCMCGLYAVLFCTVCKATMCTHCAEVHKDVFGKYDEVGEESIVIIEPRDVKMPEESPEKGAE